MAENVIAQEQDSSSSWLKVIADLEQYYVVLDKDFKNPHLINRGDSIQVDSGMHHVSVVWETINDQNFTFNAKVGETTVRRIFNAFPEQPKSSYQTIVNQTNLFISTDEKSIIYIDGKRVGQHTTSALLIPGTHQLRIEHPEYGSLNKKITVNSFNVTQINRYNENPHKNKHFQRLIPGVGYLLNGQYIHASLTYTTLIGATSALLLSNKNYNNKQDLFDEFNSKYLAASSLSEALNYKQEALSTLDDMDRLNKKITAYSLGIASIYIISTVHSFLKPKDGYPGDSRNFPKLNLSSLLINDHPTLHLTYRIDF